MLKTGPWLLGLVVVSFDDEKGPVIDFARPSSFLTAKLENDIKWISLPRETNHVHDSCFFVFRLRRDAEIPYSECSFQNHDYCYGYVYFQYELLCWGLQEDVTRIPLISGVIVKNRL